MLVELPAQVGETMGLERFEGETMRFYGCVQGLLMAVRRQLRCIEEYSLAVVRRKPCLLRGRFTVLNGRDRTETNSFGHSFPRRGARVIEAEIRAGNEAVRHRYAHRRTGRSVSGCRSGS
ncbi:hypothetical protein ALO56_100692 [Pseudomonas viridiflava]|uniref:Uncharacterized protein n=1 Tax=Pseudomonas syringae pv. ribicola TaxID=55398 RepID=A0A0Q0E5Y2_PSESI|nr:hypothetical protein ALO47_100671 [Pseudomonas syringae pv. ribicola]KPZ18181.1 hypothetical protein ALO56_100692 [Pseudomonas viridiflava]